MATRNIREYRKFILNLGPRTQREIELRIRELEARHKRSIYELAEIARLRELLKGGRDDNA
jgi:hypothetical protein